MNINGKEYQGRCWLKSGFNCFVRGHLVPKIKCHGHVGCQMAQRVTVLARSVRYPVIRTIMFKASVPARGRYTSLNESKKTCSESAEMLAMRASSRSLGAIPEALHTCIRKGITGLLRWFRFADIFSWSIKSFYQLVTRGWQVKRFYDRVRTDCT